MDLIDYDHTTLYFDDPIAPEVDTLITQASDCYGEPQAELYLLRAYFLAPEQLTVLVAIYRYYFYQHRLTDARVVAARALTIASQRLGIATDWRDVQRDGIESLAPQAMGLLRFYLLVLKASAYLYLRLGDIETGRAQIEKLLQLDARDQLGGKILLDVLNQNEADSTLT